MSIKGLQRVLRKRLPAIDRWRKVRVYQWDSTGLPEYIMPQEGTFYVVWSAPKRKNIHPYEYREIPLDDLYEVTDRNRKRLYSLTKTYK